MRGGHVLLEHIKKSMFSGSWGWQVATMGNDSVLCKGVMIVEKGMRSGSMCWLSLEMSHRSTILCYEWIEIEHRWGLGTW